MPKMGQNGVFIIRDFSMLDHLKIKKVFYFERAGSISFPKKYI
jgi:hypothetical protein